MPTQEPMKYTIHCTPTNDKRRLYVSSQTGHRHCSVWWAFKHDFLQIFESLGHDFFRFLRHVITHSRLEVFCRLRVFATNDMELPRVPTSLNVAPPIAAALQRFRRHFTDKKFQIAVWLFLQHSLQILFHRGNPLLRERSTALPCFFPRLCMLARYPTSLRRWRKLCALPGPRPFFERE